MKTAHSANDTCLPTAIIIIVAFATILVSSCHAFFDFTQYTGVIAPNGNQVVYSINKVSQKPLFGYTEKGILANIGDTLHFQLSQNNGKDTTFSLITEGGKTFRIEARGNDFSLEK
jgi:hypothetical protein